MNTSPEAQPAAGLRQAYIDLSRTKAILTKAIEHLPDGYIRLGLAEGEAADALAALRTARSLLPRDVASAEAEVNAVSGMSGDTVTSALGQIAASATRTSTSLVAAAGCSTLPSDVLACLDAALHVERLREQFA
ncbi:hypothetical protein [Actinomadura rupiterrae]|uniref:hypothetical protein n=1 Tax=Actinomadura rupiterrae TaxID=559627 RepID=UPI0020A3C524|nr:hypothetical protein [Actinomadura rupiterrae]MCP2337932.1 hypothetical protein [Actinomadura rupiterrae]